MDHECIVWLCNSKNIDVEPHHLHGVALKVSMEKKLICLSEEKKEKRKEDGTIHG